MWLACLLEFDFELHGFQTSASLKVVTPLVPAELCHTAAVQFNGSWVADMHVLSSYLLSLFLDALLRFGPEFVEHVAQNWRHLIDPRACAGSACALGRRPLKRNEMKRRVVV